MIRRRPYGVTLLDGQPQEATRHPSHHMIQLAPDPRLLAQCDRLVTPRSTSRTYGCDLMETTGPDNGY